ncbi:hypothetical protein D3C85_1297060 [compost metagenome]
MHGDRLVDRQRIGGFRCRRLGQRRQAAGKIVDTGVAAGSAQVLEAFVKQAGEGFFAPLAGAVLVGLQFKHAGHAGGEVLRRRRLAIERSRGQLGLGLRGRRDVTALLHGQTHRGQRIERIGFRVECRRGDGLNRGGNGSLGNRVRRDHGR